MNFFMFMRFDLFTKSGFRIIDKYDWYIHISETSIIVRSDSFQYADLLKIMHNIIVDFEMQALHSYSLKVISLDLWVYLFFEWTWNMRCSSYLYFCTNK